MEVACGEHGEAVYKLVTAVNNGKCKNYNKVLGQQSHISSEASLKKQANNLFVATTSHSDKSYEPITHDSVILDIDLVKKASMLDVSTESVTSTKDAIINQSGFPASGNYYMKNFPKHLIYHFILLKGGCNFGSFLKGLS